MAPSYKKCLINTILQNDALMKLLLWLNEFQLFKALRFRPL
jgi:hypothetical protein